MRNQNEEILEVQHEIPPSLSVSINGYMGVHLCVSSAGGGQSSAVSFPGVGVRQLGAVIGVLGIEPRSTGREQSLLLISESSFYPHPYSKLLFSQQ